MGRSVNLYVRDADLELWERVEDHARRRRMPVSGLVLSALEEYLARHGQPSEDHLPE